jgi:hypothetical protein
MGYSGINARQMSSSPSGTIDTRTCVGMNEPCCVRNYRGTQEYPLSPQEGQSTRNVWPTASGCSIEQLGSSSCTTRLSGRVRKGHRPWPQCNLLWNRHSAECPTVR